MTHSQQGNLQVVNNCFWRQIAKKNIYINQKKKLVQSMQISTWLAFYLWPIWLQSLAVIKSESSQRLIPSFWALPPEVAVLFDWNLSRCPLLRPVVDSDLLLCTGFNLEHAVHVLFLLRDQWMIQRLRKEMNAAWVGNEFCNTIKISFNILKKICCQWLITAQYLQTIGTPLTFEPSQFCKSAITFSTSKPVAFSTESTVTAADLETPCVYVTYYLCLPVWSAQAVSELCPKSLAIDFAIKTFYCVFWNRLWDMSSHLLFFPLDLYKLKA